MHTSSIKFLARVALGSGLLITLLSLSGCLVDSGSDLDKIRTLDQAYLHIYKDGEFIEYKVLMLGDKISGSGVTGTIRVQWDTPTTQISSNPLDTSAPYIENVLKETTTIEYLGETTTIVRYITQDRNPDSPSYGSITLHAFNSFTDSTKFSYVYHSDTKTPTFPPDPPAIIVDSPILDKETLKPISGQKDTVIDYYVLPNCGIPDATLCDQANQRFQQTTLLSDMTIDELQTDVDYFKVLKIRYESGHVTPLAGEEQLPLDLRGFCGDPAYAVSFNGYEFVYPKIGIVRFENVCRYTSPPGGTLSFNGNISRTNIKF